MEADDGGKAFCEAFVADVPEPYRILICYFARPIASWPEAFKQDKMWIQSFFPDKRITFQLASVDKLISQVQWAQGLFLKGGNAEQLLQELLHQHADWLKFLDGKTVAGTSAGADVLARYYYLLDTPGIAKGLGVLPIKVLVHYRSDYNAPNIDWDKAYTELQSHGENLPVITLREGEFKIVKQ